MPITSTTSTIRPLTTISATLKSRVSLTKQQVPSLQPTQHISQPSKPSQQSSVQTAGHHLKTQPPSRAPVKPPSLPTQIRPETKKSDVIASEAKDAPVAEALRGDPYYRARYYGHRPYYYPGASLYYNSRVRRRPNPKPYYPPPGFGYNSPYEDYRFETDFLDPSPYAKPKKKLPSAETGKDYGVIETDIGQFYDSQSASYKVPSVPSYDAQNYYSSGVGATGTGTGVGYNDYSEMDDASGYSKYTTSKPKTNYKVLPSRAPIKQTKTRNRYSSYDETDYRYSGDSSGYGTSGPEIEEVTTDQATVAKYNNNAYLPQQIIYQTAPKKKAPKTTTVSPIKITDTSIDVLTKPLGSATFNLNLSPGTVYNPGLNYNQQSANYKPIPIQPPSTSYGVPIAPPLNGYQYANPYQTSFGGYPPSSAQGSSNYVNPSSISITNNPQYPGQFAEPPPLHKQQLSDIDVNYNSLQSSYDATPKQSRPTKRKPAKVNSKRVSPKPTSLNIDEELTENDQNDYTGESYSFYKTMPQPALPNTYDQEEFHTVKNKRKQSKQAPNYYERDEKLRTTKKPKQPIEVTLRIPDEDYLDDLVKVVQTTKRPKKKGKSTTAHVLDTEDLRDAYDSNSAYYPSKSRTKTKTRQRYNQQPENDYDNYDDESADDDDYDTDRVSQVNSKEDKKKSAHDSDASGSVDPPYWDKSASIYKQYGIRARNDNFPVSGGYEVHGYNNGFRPIRNDDRSDVFSPSSSNNRNTYIRDIGFLVENQFSNNGNNRISTTQRSMTTTVPTTLYVWDGKEIPKNHKMK